MGCGQSQFSLIHPKKQRRKDRRNKDGSDDESDEDEEDKFNRNGRLISNRSTPNLVAAVENEELLTDTFKLPNSGEMSSGSSLLAHREMSSSQIDFFRTLDKKIANGPDYDEFSEKERLMENARIRQLLVEWERAKQKRLPRTQHSQTSRIVQAGDPTLSPSRISPLSRIAPSQVRVLSPKQQATSAASLSTTQPRKFRFTVPHLNGDVDKPYPTYMLRHQMQYYPAQNSGSQTGQSHSLSNSVVMYDEARGQFYTELA